MSIEEAIENKDIYLLKISLNFNSIITPKIYDKIIKREDKLQIFDLLQKYEYESFLEIISFLCLENEFELFKLLIDKYQIEDLSYSDYQCFRYAVNSESEEFVLYILDNFYVKVWTNDNESLKECIIEENYTLFNLIFTHKRCILADHNLLSLTDFCWKNDKNFSGTLLNSEQFKRIMKSPLKKKINKDILNVYDQFIKISNF
jgi:hypothetical protein